MSDGQTNYYGIQHKMIIYSARSFIPFDKKLHLMFARVFSRCVELVWPGGSLPHLIVVSHNIS